MANDIIFARLYNGRIVAASRTSPYFCLEAPDEEAAKREVEAALAFYAEAKRQLKLTSGGAPSLAPSF